MIQIPPPSPERAAQRSKMLASLKYTGYFHRAVRVRDMEATRRFYEDIVGLPFVGCDAFDYDHATRQPTNYIHTFFALGDGSYLAFFQFDDDRFPYIERTGSYMDHHAIVANDDAVVHELVGKCQSLGIQHFLVEDPICLSIYMIDPDGDFFEVAVPRPGCADALEQPNAHELLQQWLAVHGGRQKVIPRPA